MLARFSTLLFSLVYLIPLFFFNITATTDIYTLSLHDALPISLSRRTRRAKSSARSGRLRRRFSSAIGWASASRRSSPATSRAARSEEHTSELQSLRHLVCRLLLEKKKITDEKTLFYGMIDDKI